MALELEIEQPGSTQRRSIVRKPIAVIGRSASCDVQISGPTVSSRHATIKVYSDGAVIEDMQSSNGTMVNGQRITSATSVPNGSIIMLGKDGPTIKVVRGSCEGSASLWPIAATSGPSQRSSGMLWWFIGGLGVVGFVMVLLCGVLAIGTPLIARVGGGGTISNVTDENRLKQSVGLVFCGWKVTANDGTVTEEPVVFALLGVNAIATQNAAYASKFVNKQHLQVLERDGKKLYVEILAGSTGTGFTINQQGFILTNKHVVEEAENMMRATEKMASFSRIGDYAKVEPSLWVFLGQEPYAAEIVFVSQTYDMAILKCDHLTPNYFSLSKSAEIKRGSEVFAMGFPGVVRDLNNDLARMMGGENRGAGRSGTARGFLSEADLDYYQTDGKVSNSNRIRDVDVILHGAKISHGNSGGPLVASSGVVLGINTWGISEEAVNASQMIGQMQAEINERVTGVKWVR